MFCNGKTFGRDCIEIKEIVYMKISGFNLIEIMIVLVIIGILGAFCLPLYSQYITQAKRAEAEITLAKLATALEQYYTQHNSYAGATLENLNIPEIIADQRYQLAIATATDTEFTLAAKPLGIQAEKDSQCAILSLNSRGEKNISGRGNMNDCW